MRRLSWLAPLVGAALAGCRQAPASGRLEASWMGGPDTGRINAPATARWCAAGMRLEVTAVQGDTGVGVVIYATDSLRSGRYQVFNPTITPVSRPGAAVAARWFTETAIHGTQSDSGTVTLQADRGRVSGTMTAATLGVPAQTKARFRGSFSALPVEKAPLGCQADSLHQGKDSSVS